MALLEVLLISHSQQRLGIGICGSLAPEHPLLWGKTMLSGVLIQFSRIQQALSSISMILS